MFLDKQQKPSERRKLTADWTNILQIEPAQVHSDNLHRLQLV